VKVGDSVDAVIRESVFGDDYDGLEIDGSPPGSPAQGPPR
jgi:hypothetical protein